MPERRTAPDQGNTNRIGNHTLDSEQLSGGDSWISDSATLSAPKRSPSARFGDDLALPNEV